MENPNNTPEAQRPTDSFTAKDGARLFSLLEDLKRKVEGEISILRGQITDIQRDIIDINAGQRRIETGLSDTRFTRLENELREAELEKERAEVALRTAQEKIQIKQSATGNGSTKTDTGERLRSLAYDAVEEKDRKEKEEKQKQWNDIIFTAKKDLIRWAVLGVAVGIAGFIGFLINLYMKGSP